MKSKDFNDFEDFEESSRDVLEEAFCQTFEEYYRALDDDMPDIKSNILEEYEDEYYDYAYMQYRLLMQDNKLTTQEWLQK